MVKLENISTPNEGSNNSSSSDQSSTSPTSPLQPTDFTKIIPPTATTTGTGTGTALLLPHQIYPTVQHYPHPQPQPQPQPMLYFPTYYYYFTPYPYYQHQHQPQPQPEQFYSVSQQATLSPPPPPPDVYFPYAMYPSTHGPPSDKPLKGKGYWFGNRNGGMVKNKWKPKGKANPNCYPTESPKNGDVSAELANCTTVMLKNIPNSLRRNTLMKMLDRHCRQQNENQDSYRSSESQYDFVYLPFDFVRGQNLGYAFINFTSVEGASKLYTSWKNLGWSDSPKIRAITPAKLQGLEECRSHFQKSVFYCNSEGYLPVEFSPPRNGFNGTTCKAKSIGKWVYRDRIIGRVTPPMVESTRINNLPKSGRGKYATPPRFNHKFEK